VSNFAQTSERGHAISATAGVLLALPGLEMPPSATHLSGRRFLLSG